MRICKIWDADYPWDIRVEKICHSLQAKHEVHLVCRNSQRRVSDEVIDGTRIHRLPSLPRWLGKLNDLVGFPLFFNPVWIARIWQTVRRQNIDLILVRDVPLAPAALAVGRWFDVPVVLDLAENYPAMLRDRLDFTPTSLFGRVVRHPGPARVIERMVLRRVTHVIVVVEESRDRLVNAGLAPDRIAVVSNTPPADRWKTVEESTATAVGDGVHLVYLGNLDGSRGIDTAIEAVSILKRIGHVVRLSVIGSGPNLDQFRNLAARLDVTDRVVIHGRLPFSGVQSVFSKANVGLIPHYATEAWNSTIPNKLFDYMAMGIPVIVSNAKPTERIVVKEDCGMVFQDRDPQSLAEAIEALTEPVIRRQKGDRGRSAVLQQFNWKEDERKLLEAVEAALDASKHSAT